MTSRFKREQDIARSFSSSIPDDSVLALNLLSNQFYGQVGGVSIGPWPAVSGGGRNGVGTDSASWTSLDPMKRKTGKDANMRGGMIPPGWWIVLPEILGKNTVAKGCASVGGAAPTAYSLRLLPYQLEKKEFIDARDGGFFIHGTSSDPAKVGSGSDGCILITKDLRIQLANLVSSAGGAWLSVSLDWQKLEQMRLTQAGMANIA